MNKVCGLNNIGNTCYMNSAIQLLLSCKVLVQVLSNYKFKSKILNDLKNIINQYKTNSVITPIIFKQIIENRYDKFKGGRQQDSHEFIILFLDILEEEFRKEDDNEIFGLKIKNMISSIFDTNCSSIVFCEKYNEKSKSKICDRVLSLSIPNIKEVNLNNCIENYTKIEKLSGESQWLYEKKNEYVDAYKRIHIKNLSKYLIIQLKRFTFFTNSLKDNRDVYMKENFEFNGKMYDLRSIIIHSGNTNGGHYVSIVKINDKWMLCNDSNVNEVMNIDQFLKKGYIYLYVKNNK